MAEQRGTLIIAPSWVGDMVMAQCLMKALKARDPETPIDVMAPAATAPLARRMPEVREAIEVPLRHGRLDFAVRWRTARDIRGRYDAAYVLPGSLKSALIPCLAGIPRRTGYLGEQRWGLINDVRRAPAGERRRTAHMFQHLADDGPLMTPRLAVDPENQRRLCEKWSLEKNNFVALAPGAEFGPSKRWPAERYAALARALLEDRPLGTGMRIVTVGSPNDREAGQEISERVPEVIMTCGETTLPDAVDLLGAAGLVVTNDSGLMHVAAAVGRPIVAIYGSTLPDHTPPLTPAAVTLTRRLECAPCFRRVCPLGHTNCLNTLDVEDVRAATFEVLRAAGGMQTVRS